jgi:hypothetical protein
MNNPQWVDRIYSRFIGRDISYIAGGGFIILMYQWIWQRTTTMLNGNLQTSIAYLIAAYLLGLIASEIVSSLGIAPKGEPPSKKKSDNKQHLSGVELAYRLGEGNRDLALITHERTVVLMHLGSAVCGATVIAAILLIVGLFSFSIDRQKIVVLVLCLVFFVLSSRYTRWKNRQFWEERETLERLLSVQGGRQPN